MTVKDIIKELESFLDHSETSQTDTETIHAYYYIIPYDIWSLNGANILAILMLNNINYVFSQVVKNNYGISNNPVSMSKSSFVKFSFTVKTPKINDLKSLKDELLFYVTHQSKKETDDYFDITTSYSIPLGLFNQCFIQIKEILNNSVEIQGWSTEDYDLRKTKVNLIIHELIKKPVKIMKEQPKFAWPISMKATKEQYESLKKDLIDMGYNLCYEMSNADYISTYIADTPKEWNFIHESKKHIFKSSLIIEEFNKDLFLALAARTQSRKDFRIGEAVIRTKEFFTGMVNKGVLYIVRDNSNGLRLKSVPHVFVELENFRKANRKEIINHFSKAHIAEKINSCSKEGMIPKIPFLGIDFSNQSYKSAFSDFVKSKNEFQKAIDFGNKKENEAMALYLNMGNTDSSDSNKEKRKIKGYKCPYDLFNGLIKAGEILKSIGKDSYESENHILGQQRLTMPKEIVEKWEPVYEQVISINFGSPIEKFTFEGNIVNVANTKINIEVFKKLFAQHKDDIIAASAVRLQANKSVNFITLWINNLAITKLTLIEIEAIIFTSETLSK